jgi:hypothetical protein
MDRELKIHWLAVLSITMLATLIVFMQMNQPPKLGRLVGDLNPVGNIPARSDDTVQPTSNELLRIRVGSHAVPDDVSINAITAELYTALAYVSVRTATRLNGPITVVITASPDCALHGVAYTDIREVQVFTCANLPLSRAVAILAHEFVHQLAHDHYGPAHLRSDPILLEGWATWGAGYYWLGSQPDFRTFLSGYATLPLVSNHRGRSADEMNTLYYQWACFVEYLLKTYGREAFDRLYQSGADDVGSAAYQEVYGVDLSTLEAQWRVWLSINTEAQPAS